jgi:predicted RNA-binding Zn-ribbon protein involved in translation (DUF1610 family)
MQAFKDLKQLLAHFADEKVCLAYLEEQLWNGKPLCPHCGSEKVYRLSNGKQFKCGNKKTCDRKFNVLIGSYYENTKIHLSIWFGAIWLLTSHRKDTTTLRGKSFSQPHKKGFFVPRGKNNAK